MVDVEMDCSKTESGWFEIKAFLTNAGMLLDHSSNSDLVLDGSLVSCMVLLPP